MVKLPLFGFAFAICVSGTAFAVPTQPSTPTKTVGKTAMKKGSLVSSHSIVGDADPLSIPRFDGVPTEFTFAGTDKDLLGTLQSFTRGITIEGAKPPTTGKNDGTALFSDPELLDILSKIHVLRARSLSFRSQGDEAYDTALKDPQISAPSATMTAPVFGGGDKIYAREQSRLASAQKFYADRFVKQGGQAQLTLQSGKTSLAVYMFKAPRSFALLTRGPSRVIVVRADGLPELGLIGRLFRQLLNQ